MSGSSPSPKPVALHRQKNRNLICIILALIPRNFKRVAEPIPAAEHLANTAPNNRRNGGEPRRQCADLTGPGIESYIYRIDGECLTTELSGRLLTKNSVYYSAILAHFDTCIMHKSVITTGKHSSIYNDLVIEPS